MKWFYTLIQNLIGFPCYLISQHIALGFTFFVLFVSWEALCPFKLPSITLHSFNKANFPSSSHVSSAQLPMNPMTFGDTKPLESPAAQIYNTKRTLKSFNHTEQLAKYKRCS